MAVVVGVDIQHTKTMLGTDIDKIFLILLLLKDLAENTALCFF
jgi:hypothetical protein